MKPPSFGYFSATSVEDALAFLDEHEGDARVLAGGQSLVPMMNFRLSQPEYLVDINPISRLSYIRDDGEFLSIGTLTREHSIETSPVVVAKCPVLAAATRWIGHPAIRHRGTVGGSLAHNDPSAEYPVVAALLEIELVIRGTHGTRTTSFADFSRSHYVTSLEPAEMVIEIRVPTQQDSTASAFHEVSRRHGDFALVSAGAFLAMDGQVIREARLALGGVGPTPWRAREAEALLHGRPLDEDSISAAAELAAETVSPPSDMHGSADFRRHLCRVLITRCLREADLNAHL
jgi:CO/xanthine dehydrogenase FAD-binding subunit